jgi:hypothetical protein
MDDPVALDRDSRAVLVMDFQSRIANYVASDPQGVVERATRVLQGGSPSWAPDHLCRAPRRGAGSRGTSYHQDETGFFLYGGPGHHTAGDRVGHPDLNGRGAQ